MDEKSSAIEERIIQATIDCIESYGIPGATNRRIASTAGVNIAAINYYFRSKDVLIRRCMEITLKNAFDLGDIAPMLGLSAQERCIAILVELITGGLQFPGITRAHFFNLMTKGQYDDLLVERINRFVDDLTVDLQNRGCKLATNELKVALTQIMSTVILNILAPTLFEQQPGANLRDPDTCRAYVTRLVGKLLA